MIFKPKAYMLKSKTSFWIFNWNKFLEFLALGLRLLTGLSQVVIKPLDYPYVIYTTTKIFMLVVLRVKKSSSISMEEFFFIHKT